MAIPFWGPSGGDFGPTFMTNEWDVAWFNGQPLPGKWSVSGFPTLAVDKKKHAGVDGASITVQGYVPGPVELEGLIWTDEQWQFFQALTPDIWRKPTKKALLATLAVDVTHHGLTTWGISKFVVVGVAPPVDGPVKFSKVFKIKGIEYVPLDATTRTQTAQGGPIVPLAAPLVPDVNSSLNRPPDETDTSIHGEAPDNRGGE
jgi:hypothetical protein